MAEKIKPIFRLFFTLVQILCLFQILAVLNGGVFRVSLAVNANDLTESKAFMSGKVLRIGVIHVSYKNKTIFLFEWDVIK